MKVALISDLHFGVKSGDKTFLKSQIRFYEEQLVPELKKKKINEIFILGDIYDDRHEVNVQVDNVVLKLFTETLKDFKITIIVGNHDIYHKTTTEVNSLKQYNLLDNVTIYEKPEETIINGKKVLFLPWLCDYTQFEELVTGNYDYCFCHADIIGFDMGGGRLSESGILAKNFLNKADHIYSGHYHKRMVKDYDNKDITYIGSPYQLTRININEEHGYTILDIDTNKTEFVENTKSIKYYKFVYPEIDENLVKGNIVDIEIPYEKATEVEKIFKLFNHLENDLPTAEPMKIEWEQKELETETIILDTNDFNILNLFNGFVEEYETDINKNKLKASFNELYNKYKE